VVMGCGDGWEYWDSYIFGEVGKLVSWKVGKLGSWKVGK